MNVKVIDWRITSSCNNKCNFCYGCNNSIEDIQNKEDVGKIIDFIKKVGCEAVCITGGEPTLSQYFKYILEELHKAHISIFLSTNGTNYLSIKDSIESRISKLSLPLDGYNNETNVIGNRNDGSFREVKEILDYYQLHPENVRFKIKIGTVLDRRMHPEHLIKMYDFLSKYSILSKWKIFELLPEGNGQAYKTDDYDSAFYNIYTQTLKEYVSKSTSNSFEIDFAHRKDRNSAYFIILSNGDAIVPIDYLYIDGTDKVDEKFLGNVITSTSEDIIKNWNTHCNKNNFIANYYKRTDLKNPISITLDTLDKVILNLYDNDPLQLDNTIEGKINQIDSDEPNSSELYTIIKKLKKEANFVDKLRQEYIDQRIEQLYRLGVIDHVMPLIDVSMFNFSIYLANLYFYPIVNNNTMEIACYLKKHPNIAWVVESCDWKNENDIIFRIAIFAQNPNERANVIDSIKSRFGKVLKSCVIQDVIAKNVLGQRYMFDNQDKTEISLENSHIELNCRKEIKLTPDEYALLNFPKDRLYTLSELSNYLRKSEKKVRRTIEFLKDNANEIVIKKFQAVYNPILIGLRWYKFFIKFVDPQRDKIEFENEIKKYPPVMHTNSLEGGENIWDMDFEIHIKSAVEAFDFWDKIELRFEDKISKYEVIRITCEHKFDFLPEIVMRKIESNLIQKKLFRLRRKH